MSIWRTHSAHHHLLHHCLQHRHCGHQSAPLLVLAIMSRWKILIASTTTSTALCCRPDEARVLFQQYVAVSVRGNAVLVMGDETAAPSNLPSTHLQDLDCRIRSKDEILVGPHKYEDNEEGSGHDHAVADQRHC